jgi:small subunit ribosomal protein S9
MSTSKYIEGIGRRKTSVARVRITPSTKITFIVNDKELKDYFPTKEMQMIAGEALPKSGVSTTFSVSAHVNGGGIHSQAEAVRHGMARAIVTHDLELRSTLKKIGFLKRDPRAKERKHPGLKKARKAPTWSKR